MGSHSVTSHPAAATFPPYPSRSKLVLDLATPEGCKAELTYAPVPAIISVMLNISGHLLIQSINQYSLIKTVDRMQPQTTEEYKNRMSAKLCGIKYKIRMLINVF